MLRAPIFPGFAVLLLGKTGTGLKHHALALHLRALDLGKLQLLLLLGAWRGSDRPRKVHLVGPTCCDQVGSTSERLERPGVCPPAVQDAVREASVCKVQVVEV